jgi:hypothetical protein
MAQPDHTEAATLEQFESTGQPDPVSFGEKETRKDDMEAATEQWLADLKESIGTARSSDLFESFLDAQARFHDYSRRNRLLIQMQCPAAKRVAGYHTWQNEFDRHVKAGEDAIWIWSPIITEKCPECGNGEKYHNIEGCEYDDKPPEAWEEGCVGFRPTPVFDISQTEGEPLPELPMEVGGSVSDQDLAAAVDTGEDLGFDVEIVQEEDWDEASQGYCKETENGVEVRTKAQESNAQTFAVLVHEFAHGLLHTGEMSEVERKKREVEAEAVAYAVGRHIGLEMERAQWYLASWDDEAEAEIDERLDRISEKAQELIDAL